MAEKLRDDPSVREVYSNRVAALSADGAVVAITLAHVRNVPATVGAAGGDTAFVNNRICIPEATVVQLHGLLGQILQRIQAKKTEIAATAKRTN